MKLLKSLLLVVLTLPTLLLADSENHIAIGSRPMSEEAAAQIQAEKEKQEAAEMTEEMESESAGYVFDRYPPVYYSNVHHWLTAVSILDSDRYTLELEDGSIWKINSYDGVKALNWRLNDPLTITQNNRWFSRYNYRIINKSNGTSAEANLFLGPVELGQFSRYIIAVDYTTKEIMLSDNTRWEISYLDKAIFRDWSVNDYIIIGTNSNTSIWDLGSDVLLINVNMNNATRAKQF
jgi:hypothetical protein